MNVILAISIIVTLVCVTIVRVVCIYNIRTGRNVMEHTTSILLGVGAISLVIFIIEFIFNPFNIIL